MERSAAALDRRMDELLRKIRERRGKVTPQSMAIYRALLEAEDHPSPKVLYERIRRRMPSLSFATIYKAVDTLVDLGLAREVSEISATKRYDANLEKHHHLVCTRCKRIVDFYDASLDKAVPHKVLGEFRVQAVSVQVLGLCGACARKSKT